MGAAFFYHMTRTPLVETLPVLLGKSLGAGWQVLLRPPTEAREAWLDDLLWTYRDDSFLPHGRPGPTTEAHPILISATSPFERDALLSVEGATLTPDEVKSSTRAMILFDGTDPGAVQVARDQWRALTQAKCEAQYWSQESGTWEMKAKEPKD